MSEKCPICKKKFGHKYINYHIEMAHEKIEKHFECFDDCVRCCEDPILPISLSIKDLKRISSHLNSPLLEVYKKYCIVGAHQEKNINRYMVNLNLFCPCKFLKNMKCSIYLVRPLMCRIFPYTLKSEEDFDYLGYKCVDKGLVNFSKDEINNFEKIMIQTMKETLETIKLLEFPKYIVNIAPTDRNNLLSDLNVFINDEIGLDIIMKEVLEVDGNYLFGGNGQKPSKKQDQQISEHFRILVHNLAESKIQSIVGNDFLKKIESIN